MAPNDSFAILPEYLQRRIDKAFDSCIPSKESTSTDSGGGFICGGFLVEELEPASQIPLSAIPEALQQLDLPPDDEQVLQVFKNAASGWQLAANHSEAAGSGDGEHVLLEHRAEEYEDSDEMDVDAAAEQVDDFDEEAAPDDEYEENEEQEEDSDSDEYVDESRSKSRRSVRSKKTRRRTPSSDSSDSLSTPKKPTPRQKKTCLDTYALFFPDVSEADLPDQRVTMGDIQRLSKLIGDKLKAEEILDMLGEFSAAPDKSMSFENFQTMMLKILKHNLGGAAHEDIEMVSPLFQISTFQGKIKIDVQQRGAESVQPGCPPASSHQPGVKNSSFLQMIGRQSWIWSGANKSWVAITALLDCSLNFGKPGNRKMET
ncbi:hypothetical protein R3P38DRAFT_3350758 [Favolaschia claudopus]|uniref:Uncharacterized protein n=1 Tax=Favolaschia claudopus TaxID=2862362 RepID=A0AAW0C9A1_9AGAR